MQPSILFVGDLHLGRRPVGLDDAFAQLGLSAHALSPRAAFGLLVDHILTSSIAVVVFAGDMVDHENDRFEAFEVLKQGLRRLGDAGVAVYCIAGNHDVKVLPALAEHLKGMTLLGAAGRWQLIPLRQHGIDAELLGYSFPTARHPTDPFDSESLPQALGLRDGALPMLGVVHGDLGVTQSPYAPIRREALLATGAAAFFLGHIHRPTLAQEARPVGYLGTLVGLDPGEWGARGPWEVRVRGREVEIQQIPFGPIRYERLRLHVGGHDDLMALWQALYQEAEALLQALGAALRWVKVIALRVTFVGESPVALQQLGVEGWEGKVLLSGGVSVIVERVIDETLPPLPLALLAKESSPAGEIARWLQRLEGGHEEGGQEDGREARLIEEASGVVGGALQLYAPDDHAPQVEDELIPVMRSLLRALWHQRGDGPGAGEARPKRGAESEAERDASLARGGGADVARAH